MALSKEIQLAHAQRRLRRLKEDAAAFRMRSAEIPEDHRKPMQRWFQEMVQQQRDTVRKLASDEQDRRTDAA
jgi:hypothetical protein